MSTGTSERLLDSAEQLFADHGIGAVSLRQIVAEAGANVAAVNYHFGSKAGLVRAVFHRRIASVNEERLRLLNCLRKKHDDKTIPLDELLEAFLGPAISLSGKKHGSAFFRLVARAHGETDPVVQQVMFQELQSVVSVFLEEIEKILPELSAAERGLRLAFCAGAMVQAALLPMKSSFVERFFKDKASSKDMLPILVRFCEKGFAGEGICE